MRKTLVLAVAGGSGSGKTTVASALKTHFGRNKVQVLELDNYYKDNRELPLEERVKINYDHPDAFDEPFFLEHVAALKNGQAVAMPTYDYTEHQRGETTIARDPAPVLLVEGILVLALASVRPLLDVKIFVDTPPDLRFIRRLNRDIRERGRTVESVIDRYMKQVRPMHTRFVEPSKQHADMILPMGYNENAFQMMCAGIGRFLDGHSFVKP